MAKKLVQKLDWLRRFLGTLLGFVLFGVVGVLFKIVLYPYAKRYPNHTPESLVKGRAIVSGTWAFFVKCLHWFGILSVEYQGFERLGRKGQLILANHPSLLDVVLIFAKQPNMNCIVKPDLMDNPSMSSPIKACGFIPNCQSEALLEKCANTLSREALLIFPEGTRTGWDGVVKFNRGAVSVGLRSADVITPVVIKMSPLNFKKGQPWYKLPSCRIRYQFMVGEDILPATWLAEKPLPIAARRLNAYLEDYFNTQTRIENGIRTTN
ncbi:lysophospholipid acyltransferase family protein [Lonepinella sp. BR2271]|uniref:lysophospholipid acyltransferase family protein n=1 Tax=Lonepinella sp. BR2271 TaxID=3434550 RepID=UPI003F6E2F2B